MGDQNSSGFEVTFSCDCDGWEDVTHMFGYDWGESQETLNFDTDLTNVAVCIDCYPIIDKDRCDFEGFQFTQIDGAV